MSTWQDAPDASGMWWVRREDDRDVVLQVDVGADGVWINRGGEGWCSIAEYPGAKWCRVTHPDRVEALEVALRQVCEAHRAELIGPPGHAGAACDWCYPGGGAARMWPCASVDCPVGRGFAALLGATVAGERGSRG